MGKGHFIIVPIGHYFRSRNGIFSSPERRAIQSRRLHERAEVKIGAVKPQMHRMNIIYNSFVFGSSIIACLIICIYFYLTTGQSVDRAWWPILAILGSLFSFAIILIIGLLFRNYLIFGKIKCNN
jgi:hypothetical protein